MANIKLENLLIWQAILQDVLFYMWDCEYHLHERRPRKHIKAMFAFFTDWKSINESPT